MNAPQSFPASGLTPASSSNIGDVTFAAGNELLAAERRFQLARDVGKAFDLSLNCMQIARWLHPFDEIARHAFFRELRRDKMKAAGLPLEILGRAA